LLGKLSNGGKKRENGRREQKEERRKENRESGKGERDGLNIPFSNVALVVRTLSSRESASAFLIIAASSTRPVILSASRYQLVRTYFSYF